MAYLTDTNVITRWALPRDPLYPVCRAAILTLHDQGETGVVAVQNIVEYWALATRPPAANGLGLTSAQTTARIRMILRNFTLLPDTPDIFPLWRQLVETHNVIGRQVYDARIAATMQAHSITNILTFNGQDFRRFPGIAVFDPNTV